MFVFHHALVVGVGFELFPCVSFGNSKKNVSCRSVSKIHIALTDPAFQECKGYIVMDDTVTLGVHSYLAEMQWAHPFKYFDVVSQGVFE
ncbi:MAG: hypothetical protein Ct9H300mP19_18290 [Dehalococcoidia bacterium]|nr:MAG: hypothetical protein Ct9H300mP19_18290 [Dehalococcoidia bacterium]